MRTTRATKGRSPVKKEFVASEIRHQIVSGKLRSGDRVPTRTELEEAFQTSTATVQSALDDLVRDGFVRVHGRRGTFVTDELPFLTRYGFIFPREPGTRAEWPRFFTAIANEVLRANLDSPIQLPIYTGINNPMSQGYRDLEHDIRTRRLAGLVLVAESVGLLHKPLLESANLPIVRIADEPNMVGPEIVLDVKALICKAFEHFRSTGKRRVAILALHDWLVQYREVVDTELAARGLQSRSYWQQSFHYTLTDSTRNCTELLMRSQAVEPFDALFITDDNIVLPALEGILRAIPTGHPGIDIIAHCNFPATETLPLPVKRIGFDVRRVVTECIRSIDAQRQADTLADDILIPPQFDHELRGTF